MKRKTDISILRWISKVAGGKKIYIGILLLVQMVLGITGVYYALILRNVIDAAAAGNRRGFFLAMAAFAGLTAAQILLRAVVRHYTEYSRAVMENRFKGRLFHFLLREDYETMTAVHSGEWMNRLTSDTVVVADGLAQIVPGLAGMLAKMIGALVMILKLEPVFVYILVPGGILLVILTYGFRRQLKKLHRKMQEADGKLRVYLQESLASMLVVRAFVKEDSVLREADARMEQHKGARMKKNRFSNICNIGFGGAMQGAYVLGAGVCGYGILTGTMTYGTMMAILQLVSQIQSPFANITGYLPKYYAMQASAERLREIELSGQPKAEELKSMAEVKDFYEHSLAGIALQHADFTYQPRGEREAESAPVVLKDLNLSLRKGEYAAFTGPSGCGKSTVLKILLCLYALEAGERVIDVKMPAEVGERAAEAKRSSDAGERAAEARMSLDAGERLAEARMSSEAGERAAEARRSSDAGERAAEAKMSSDAGERAAEAKRPSETQIPLDASWRRLFAYVPQGNHLMSGTIREIIAFSDPEGMKQEERIRKALQIACAEEFVSQLPAGLDTLLGERGLGLSEGQMQRIAIARAVFSDNPVLMLDESTSALDEATEERVLANLREMTDKTVLIVTHRPAALAICDKEIRFSEEGCIVRRTKDGNNG